MEKYKYGFLIAWSEEDQEFIARCLDFPGVSGSGDSREEALGQAEEGLGLVIEILKGEGTDLPSLTLYQDLKI